MSETNDESRSWIAQVPLQVYGGLLAYFAVLFCLLDLQTLWLDELLQLLGTHSGTFEHVDVITRTGVASVPLGWMPQLLAIRILGYSVEVARLPSVLFSVALGFTVYLTARELRIRYPLLATSILLLLPLQFRYAIEARPYLQALFLSALASYLFLRILRSASLSWYFAYLLVLIAGLYSQPFTIFTACSHVAWLLLWCRNPKLLVQIGGAVLLALLSFLPWYLYASPMWQKVIQAEGFHLSVSAKIPLMILRELTGAGYLGALCLIGLAGYGLRQGAMRLEFRRLLLVSSILPIFCVVSVDATFSYFLAIRQMSFILPPLVLLAAEGLSGILQSPRRKLGLALLGLLLLIFMIANVQWLRKPRENWALAAATMHQSQVEHAACTVAVPATTLPVYALFEASLLERACTPDRVPAGNVVLATSPYASETDKKNVQPMLSGKRVVSTHTTGMSTIQVFR
ncbi:glycosyltransferase family 39 protein [Bryobacter aggregatus]|uniref:glycosyltransferase family 39 protein n=1 Tax=Bryobacter aggregatus TaxID=360054 RepID=UPI0004E285DD|nr:glycosyltransferase family 39 protein [Bryobacter aggregatus]